MSYEYKVVPAPTRGLKAKGVRSAEDRFANALETAMNDLASDGWEYLRTDTLPSEQREGLMSKTTVFQNMLVFRRVKKAAHVAAPAPKVQAARPAPAVAAPKPTPELTADKPKPVTAPPVTAPTPPASPDVAAE